MTGLRLKEKRLARYRKTMTTSNTPTAKFRKVMQQILSVPKDEMQRREERYKAQRKLKKTKSKRPKQ